MLARKQSKARDHGLHLHVPRGFTCEGLIATTLIVLTLFANSPTSAAEPEPTQALRDLDTSYFPFTTVKTVVEWKHRRGEIQRRVLVAAGLYLR